MKTINYSRMKMDDIHPEARRIAVSWVEGFEKIGTFEIEQKVKLGSDIMHFAMAYHEEQKDSEIVFLKAEIALLTEDRDGLLRKCEELNRQVNSWQMLHDLVKQESERKGKRLHELLNNENSNSNG